MADTSGSVSVIYTADVMIKANWSLVSQDVSTNTSVILVRAYFEYNWLSGTSYAGEDVSVYIDGSSNIGGVSLYGSINSQLIGWDYPIQPTISVFEKRVTLQHSANGSKTFKMYVHGSGRSGEEKTFTLSQLPQASQITSFPNFTMGNDFTVLLDRKSTSYTHDLTFKVGATTVKTITGVAESVNVSLTSAEQDVIYKAIPNSTAASITLTCQTKNGTTNIGSATSSVAIASVPSSIVPTFTSISHSETNTNVSSIIGAYAKGLSNIKLTIEGASGVKYSTITSYRISYLGTSYSSNTINTGIINWSGNQTVSATITDSRGRTATKSITISALDYASPKITTFIVQRCNSDGSLNEMGTYAKVTRIGSVSSLNSKNNYTFRIYSKTKGTTEWGAVKVSGSSNTGEVIMNYTNILSVYNVTSSYDFRLDLQDKFNTTTVQFSLSTAQTVMSWGKTGVGIGKIWEQGALDVSGDAYFDGRIGYIIPVASGTATAITLSNILLTDGYTTTFRIASNNNGSATTINGKPLYKPNTTSAPKLISGKVATVWYSTSKNCFFLDASAEGTASVSDVLASKTFSNDDDTGLTGTMPNRGAVVITPSTANQTILEGSHNGSGYVKGDVNLTSSNIISGKSIFGVNGTARRYATGTSWTKGTASGFVSYRCGSDGEGFAAENSISINVTGLPFTPKIVRVAYSGDNINTKCYTFLYNGMPTYPAWYYSEPDGASRQMINYYIKNSVGGLSSITNNSFNAVTILSQSAVISVTWEIWE